MHRTVAFIPVRGGSKSIPKKNIKLLAGKPLIYWTARAANECPEIDVVYIATDDQEIAQAAQGMGLAKVEVIGRSPETATDTASTESALLEFAEQTECDRIVLIQATSPLLQASDLLGGLMALAEIGADTLLSTVEQKRFIWKLASSGLVEPQNYDPYKRPRRQEFGGYLVENGAFYIMSRAGLLAARNRLHGKIATWTMDPASFVEIDEPADWGLVENALRKRGQAYTNGLAERLKNIKLVLTDVDGVLTDAGMYYSEFGDELKKFNTRDGKGFELLRNAGIKTGIITSENTQIVARRAKKLKIDYLEQGATEKMPALLEIAKKAGLPFDRIAYIGDDIADISILEQVGIAACPIDAVALVQSVCEIKLNSRGGYGAFRELAELIIRLRTSC